MSEPSITQRLNRIRRGYDSENPAASMSLAAEAYVDPFWFDVETGAVFARSWQWVCHAEKLREPGSYVATEIAGRPIVLVRDGDRLRAFYNVCKHRAHHLVEGEGTIRALTCPYHAWVYDLGGRLTAARHTRTSRGSTPPTCASTPSRSPSSPGSSM